MPSGRIRDLNTIKYTYGGSYTKSVVVIKNRLLIRNAFSATCIKYVLYIPEWSYTH